MPPMETCFSAISSSIAACTLAGARLISSASTKFTKIGPELDVEALLARLVDPGADDVGGHQVGGELDPGEVTADDGGEAAHRQRLGYAGHTFEQDVTLGEQGDHQLLDHVLLPDDHPLNLGDGVPEQLRGLLVSELAGWVGAGRLLAGWARTTDCSRTLLLFIRVLVCADRHARAPCARRRPFSQTQGPAYWPHKPAHRLSARAAGLVVTPNRLSVPRTVRRPARSSARG